MNDMDLDANIVADDGADVDAAVEHQWASAAGSGGGVGGKASGSHSTVHRSASSFFDVHAAAAGLHGRREERRIAREEAERRERTTTGTAMISVVRDHTSPLAAMALGLGVDVPVATTTSSSSARNGVTPRGAPPAAVPPVIEGFFNYFQYTSIDQYLAAQKKALCSFYGNRIASMLDVHRQLQDAARPELPTPAMFGVMLGAEALERQRQAELTDPSSSASIEQRRARQAMHAARLVQPLQATTTARRVRSVLSRRPQPQRL
jgi:hypothetical protein